VGTSVSLAEQGLKRGHVLGMKLVAEAACAFLITATATGIDVFYYGGQQGVDYVSRWLARGLIAAVTIYAFSEVSGAHGDPAVTFAFALRRDLPLRNAVAYVAAQFAGALIAAGLLFALFGPAIRTGASHPSPPFGPLQAVLCELVLTFVLVLVVLRTAQQDAVIGKQAALAVGFTIAACGMVAGPISGASMNPARTLAPQLLAGAFGQMWIYVAGPLAGAALATVLARAIGGRPSQGERKAARGR